MSRLRRQLPLLVVLVVTPILTYQLAPDRVGTHEGRRDQWYSPDPVIAAAEDRRDDLVDSNVALRMVRPLIS